MIIRICVAVVVGLNLFTLTGCGAGGAEQASSNETHPVEPIGMQLVRASPDLKGQRFTNLLHFEQKSDAVFVTVSGAKPQIDELHAHTGRGSLRIAAGGATMTVKLGSLLGGRAFPGDWTLAGAYFYSEHPTEITVACDAGGRTIAQNRVALPAGRWAAAMVDLSTVEQSPRPPGPPMLRFGVEAPGEVWCDDVLLIDNTHWYVGGEESPNSPWSVARRGFSFVCESPNTFSVRLSSADALSSGWKLEEANDHRARFSSTGKNKRLTLYPDGRSYWDGQFRALAATLRDEPLYAQQSASPAEIEVPEIMGRLNRQSDGDENNDGYDESRGTYTLIAAGARLDASIVPAATPVLRPVLEITGLPAGKALVTLEGRLIETVYRLEDGTLLVEIPARITRPTQVNIRIQ